MAQDETEEASMTAEKGLTEGTGGVYTDAGWEHWPDDPWFSYQFRRALGETQEGGGAVSECFRAATRITPHDNESWYSAWLEVAERNDERARLATTAGHFATAKAARLRACNYYRSCEFMLGADDERRREIFARCEASFRSAGALFAPPVEILEIPFEGRRLHGYLLRPASAPGPWPVVVAFGGLDSFKEEVYYMVARGVLDRGFACLLLDGPGQGASLRWDRIYARHDWEVPIGAVIDYMAGFPDLDLSRIGVCGASLGGYYAARAACYESRIAAAVSLGAEWDVGAEIRAENPDSGAAEHYRFIFGTRDWEEIQKLSAPFTLSQAISEMKCPYLIVHGDHDFFGREQFDLAVDSVQQAGIDVTVRVVEPDETGADHCQHDNPTIGNEIIGDWFADVLLS
jgi:dienelactone hydrolase